MNKLLVFTYMAPAARYARSCNLKIAVFWERHLKATSMPPVMHRISLVYYTILQNNLILSLVGHYTTQGAVSDRLWTEERSVALAVDRGRSHLFVEQSCSLLSSTWQSWRILHKAIVNGCTTGIGNSNSVRLRRVYEVGAFLSRNWRYLENWGCLAVNNRLPVVIGSTFFTLCISKTEHTQWYSFMLKIRLKYFILAKRKTVDRTD